MEGEVDLEKMEGEVDLEKMEGEVDLEKMEGEVDLEKMEGEVDLEKLQGEVDLEKMQGEVTRGMTFSGQPGNVGFPPHSWFFNVDLILSQNEVLSTKAVFWVDVLQLTRRVSQKQNSRSQKASDITSTPGTVNVFNRVMERPHTEIEIRISDFSFIIYILYMSYPVASENTIMFDEKLSLRHLSALEKKMKKQSIGSHDNANTSGIQSCNVFYLNEFN
ncbi:hypothetical protein STEG23_029977 [Scotinomys teguina]